MPDNQSQVTARENELLAQLDAQTVRADKAEADLKEAQAEIKKLKKSQGKPTFDESDEHIVVVKGGEEIKIHPSTVKAHTDAGWRIA